MPSRWRLVAYAVLATIAFLALQTGIQFSWYVEEEGGHVHWLTALISAGFVGLLVYAVLESARRRHLADRKRFETIAEANHHVRNALEAMVGHFYLMKGDSPAASELLQSVERIKWVLDEVLPRGHGG